MLNPAIKAELLRKGQEVATALEAILNGKDVDLSALLPPGPSRAEVRLRAFLEQIDRAIKSIDTSSYGRCDRCKVHLDPAALREQPWLSHCPLH